MKKRLLLVMLLILAMIFTQSSFAEDTPKYSYDKENTSIYAEFTAMPETITKDNWITELAGGQSSSIKVRLGTAQADSRRDSRLICIEIIGNNATRSFLSSACSNEYYEDTKSLRSCRVLFRTSTQTYDNTFLKGSQIPMSATLQAEFDTDEKLKSLKLGFSDNGEEVNNKFWEYDISENIYTCDLLTLNIFGDLIDCLNGRPIQEQTPEPPAPAKDIDKIIKYDFDSIEVLQAAEFNAFPVNMQEGSWIYELAGGNGKNISVLYGKVKLIKNNVETTEDFIKICGENGSERFLSNSASYEYYENTYKYKTVKISFWSGKQLEGSTVVKDYTKPVKEAVLSMSFDLEQNFTDISLGFLLDGKGTAWDGSYQTIYENAFKCDLSSLISYGISYDKNDNKVSDSGADSIIAKESIDNAPPVIEEEKIRYDFDDVESIYDLTFKVFSDDALEQPWVNELIGQNDKSLNISFGKLDLKKNSESVGTEHYIEIAGEKGSRRFLCNNIRYEVDSDNDLKKLKLLFWEGTRIIDNKVVKVYSDRPSQAVIMYLDFGEKQKVNKIQLYFTEKKWVDVQDEFFQSSVLENTSTASIETLVQNGKITEPVQAAQVQENSIPEVHVIP